MASLFGKGKKTPKGGKAPASPAASELSGQADEIDDAFTEIKWSDVDDLDDYYDNFEGQRLPDPTPAAPAPAPAPAAPTPAAPAPAPAPAAPTPAAPAPAPAPAAASSSAPSPAPRRTKTIKVPGSSGEIHGPSNLDLNPTVKAVINYDDNPRFLNDLSVNHFNNYISSLAIRC